MNIQTSLAICARIYTGDVVRHTNTARLGIVLEISRTQRDASIEYLVRTDYPEDAPSEVCYSRKTEWNSQRIERVIGRDPYRRYLALCAIEDDPAGQTRRATHPRRRVRQDGGRLPEALWNKMYWRFTNRRKLLPAGGYANHPLGRDHWEKAAIDCLQRRDRIRYHRITGKPVT